MSTPTNCTMMCDFGNVKKLNYTCDQLRSYCSQYIDWLDRNKRLESATYVIMAVFGIVGLIGYIFMLILLARSLISGPSALYHKAMTIFELIHMIVMIEAAVVRLLVNTDRTSSYVLAVWVKQAVYGWVVGDWSKLSVSALTVFVSLERLVAVMKPTWFHYVNTFYVAWIGVVVSFLVGSLHVTRVGTLVVVPSEDNVTWASATTTFGAVHYNTILQIIFVLKIVLSILIAQFTGGIVRALYLRRRQKLISNSNQAEDQNWRGIQRLCILQFILAAGTLLDHATWIPYKVLGDWVSAGLDPGKQSVQKAQYADAVQILRMTSIYDGLRLVQTLASVMEHSLRFYFYFLLSKLFRDGTMKLIKRGDVHQTRVMPLHSMDLGRSGQAPASTSLHHRESIVNVS